MFCFRLAAVGLLLPGILLAESHRTMPLADPVTTGEPLNVEAALHEIQVVNPQLRAARTRWEAAKERLLQAAAWEDPRVGVDVERSNRRLNSYNDAEWMITQSIPVSGKVKHRKEAASADIAEAEAMLRQTELDIEVRARSAFYRLAGAEAQLRINTQNQALMRQLIEVTTSKYESGRLRQSDVLMAQTELSQMEEARVDFLRAYSEAQTALNSLMKRAPQTPLGSAKLPDFAPKAVSLESLQAMAIAQRPQLSAADNRIKAAQARVGLAERDRLPDPEFRIEARQFNGSGLYNIHEYDTGVFISLPWANGAKYRAAIREAKKMAEAETHDRSALETETIGMVRDIWQRLQSLEHHVDLFHNRLLPLARQTIEATRSSYESDRATLPEVLTAQHTAQEVEAMLNEHLTNYFIAQAELIALTGSSSVGNAKP